MWKYNKMSWCGCKKKESGASTERKSTARVEKAVQSRKAKAQQSSTQPEESESTAEQHMARRVRKRSKRGG